MTDEEIRDCARHAARTYRLNTPEDRMRFAAVLLDDVTARYWLFGGRAEDMQGGMGDFACSAETAALAEARVGPRWDWWQVVDSFTGQTVKKGGR